MLVRLLPANEAELCAAVDILDPTSWPQELSPEYGETELQILCDEFMVSISGCQIGLS
jgi:hypothetical protein